ncbi:unnamed protein product [Kuraishia capsulata CBS 1993]|uniref:Uncharacterized protein n=1 Tax=Kuraishia capsulata CBS 1993 TaxID=1382522 RepID=W6MSE6_9ASCO|nr:uncharacterized protein KUCA_T00005719001 [Kuraishia capsulata CBS 1993]CDK29726.1 unnamed protein product [Kuraishia capsulata CBS 1993]
MPGSISLARDWDLGQEQRYLAIDPSGEEISLYQTDNTTEDEDKNIFKVASRGGFDSIQCLHYSRADVGITAVGQLNGSAYIFDISSPQSSLLRLKPKQARPCNSIGLNSQGLVVLGFDRGRQDHSVQIWDMQHYSRSSSNDHITKPLVKYVQNEAILSTTFLENEPTNLVTGSYKFLREFDVRSEQPLYQLATKCTSGVTVDPFNPYHFASYGDDGTVSFWDRRKMVANTANASSTIISEAPLLTFNRLLSDQRKSNPAFFRFSTITRGEFSALFSGDLVKRWQLGSIPASKQGERSNSDPAKPELKPKSGKSLFVSKVSDVKTKYERVISFDYSPNLNTEHGIDLVCMRQSGSVYRMHVVSSQEAVEFNAFNDITFSGPVGTFTKMVKDSLDDDADQAETASLTEAASKKDDHSHAISSTSNAASDTSETDNLNAEEMDIDDEDGDESDVSRMFVSDLLMKPDVLLDNDICSTIRRRASLGYGVDLAHNMSIVDQQHTIGSQDHLRNIWRWMDIIANNVAQGHMISGDYDLGFLGVLGIWHGVDGFQNQKRYRGVGVMNNEDLIHATKSLVERRFAQIKAASSSILPVERKSQKEYQRRLCMYVAGWDFGTKELNEKYKNLVAKEQYERAAGWAVFNGDVGKAVEILSNSKSERLRIMSTAVAGYLSYKDSPMNSMWRDQCRRLALDLENPYLRVIFAFIADNNWWDVLDEAALPLRERLGVALRFLPDNELTVYLDRIAKSAIMRGEVEGIILTGITPKGIDLLQSYVDRTSDVQTACIIAAHGCPRYFSDQRVSSWTESYRKLLNSWSLFSARAKFDVSRTRLSKTMDGKVTTKVVPRQVYLQCVKCNKNIAETKKSTVGGYGIAKSGYVKGFGSGKLGHPNTSCPHCGSALPRCAICLLPQGAPLPKEYLMLEGEVDTPEVKIASQFREWFSFCLSCNHGMHAGHAEEWFSKHYICAVPDCDCKCNSK